MGERGAGWTKILGIDKKGRKGKKVADIGWAASIQATCNNHDGDGDGDSDDNGDNNDNGDGDSECLRRKSQNNLRLHAEAMC